MGARFNDPPFLLSRSSLAARPVHHSCFSVPLLLLWWIVLSASSTSTRSSSLVAIPADDRRTFTFATHRDSTISLCLFFRACLTFASIYRCCSTKAFGPPLCSDSSIRGSSVSRVVRACGQAVPHNGTCWLEEASPVACVSSKTPVMCSHPSTAAKRNTIPHLGIDDTQHVLRGTIRTKGLVPIQYCYHQYTPEDGVTT